MVRAWRWVGAAAAVVAAAGTAAASDPGPGTIPPAFPPPAEHADLLDLTPPELAAPPPPDLHHHLEEPAGGWFGGAEVLIWRARTDILDYALVDPIDDLTPQGKVQNLQPHARAGFRFGAGYQVPGRGVDVSFTYTYFRTTDDQSAAAPPGGVLYPSLTRPGVVDDAAQAAAAARIQYNAFDLDLGRTIDAGPHWTARVFGGVRIASLTTDLQGRYDGVQARLDQVDIRSVFNGAGPNVGAGVGWDLGRGLALTGTVRGGLAFGTLQGSNRETNGAGQVLVADVSDSYSAVVPFAAVGLGAAYKWRRVSFAAGYEVTNYFNGVTRPVLTNDFAEGKVARRRADLSFDGVTLRAAVDY